MCYNFVAGGFLEGRLLSREGLVQAAALPSLDMLLGETVNVLNSAASKTSSLLSSQQLQLSCNLQQYIKDKTETSEGS